MQIRESVAYLHDAVHVGAWIAFANFDCVYEQSPEVVCKWHLISALTVLST